MFITKHLVKEKQYLSKKLVLYDRNRCIKRGLEGYIDTHPFKSLSFSKIPF